MSAGKLTPAQQQLVDLLKHGGRVLRTSDYPKKWMRNDTNKTCTTTAQSLLLRGIAGIVRADPPVRFYDHELRLNQAEADNRTSSDKQ